MRGIILAAGRGRRMGQLTRDKPKCLLEIKGKSLLSMQIEAFKKAGVTEIGIVTGYKRERIAEYGLTEFYNPKWENSNMVVSLTCAEDWLKDNHCIISYSDIFFETAAITLLKNTTALLAITFDPNWRVLWEQRFEDPLSDAETFRVDQDNLLLEIGNSPKSFNEIQGQYMGLIRLSPSGWKSMKVILETLSNEKLNQIHLTEVLNIIANTSPLKIRTIAYHGFWGEIDSESDLNLFSSEKTF